MNEESKFKDILDVYVKNVQKLMEMTGGVVPHITVFGEHKNEFVEGTTDPKQAVVNIIIPSEFMRSDKTKEVFMEEVFPKASQKIKEIINPMCVGWASEVWIRKAEVGDDLSDVSKLPISDEALFIALDNGVKTKSFCYIITRKGKKVTEEGELIDDIELTLKDLGADQNVDSEFEGRFSNLYKKLLES